MEHLIYDYHFKITKLILYSFICLNYYIFFYFRNNEFIRKKMGKDMKTYLNIDMSIVHFLRMFREGDFGKVMLDDIENISI